MTSKFLVLCGLGAIVALISSCAPFVPYQQRAPLQAQAPDIEPPQTIDAVEKKKIEKVRKRVAKKTTKPTSSGGGQTSPTTTTQTPSTGGGATTPQTQRPVFRYALQIPGKEGFVFNPFTNNPVDVRGIPSGTLVRDPQDANPDHKFRVP